MPETNWVTENWTLIQESGGNIFMEDSTAADPVYVSLQEYESTSWPPITTTGSG